MPTLLTPDVSIHYEQFGVGPDIVWVAGGGVTGEMWHGFNVPAFEATYRNTTFDNRGSGATTCTQEPPWTIGDFARDTAALIEARCDPPVVLVGASMGGFIVTQLALDSPDLVRCAIAIASAACGGQGWLGDYMHAEVELRRRGGTVDGLFAVTHYAAQLFPARMLGDSAVWEDIKARFGSDTFREDWERSLVPQWEACLAFDVRARLPECTVPLDVLGLAEDISVPPQYGQELARLAPTGSYHHVERLGHAIANATAAEAINPLIAEIVARHR